MDKSQRNPVDFSRNGEKRSGVNSSTKHLSHRAPSTSPMSPPRRLLICESQLGPKRAPAPAVNGESRQRKTRRGKGEDEDETRLFRGTNSDGDGDVAWMSDGTPAPVLSVLPGGARGPTQPSGRKVLIRVPLKAPSASLSVGGGGRRPEISGRCD